MLRRLEYSPPLSARLSLFTMSLSYVYERISPSQSQSHCHGARCYCFYGKSPLDEEVSDISSISSWPDNEDDNDYIELEDFDLPPVVYSVIEPFLEPEDDDDYMPPNRHLYFDEDGNEITKEQYDVANEPPDQIMEDQEDDDWAFRVNGINFYHPRVLLAYFRFVSMYNELAEDDEKIRIPLMSKELARKMLSHSSFRNPPLEFLMDIHDLQNYIDKYTSH